MRKLTLKYAIFGVERNSLHYRKTLQQSKAAG